MEGTVKWFNVKKGYGFITGEDGKEYFVHYTALPNDQRVNENDRVSFDAVDSDRGIQAQNVKFLGAGVAPVQEEEEPVQADEVEEPAPVTEEEPAQAAEVEEPAPVVDSKEEAVTEDVTEESAKSVSEEEKKE